MSISVLYEDNHLIAVNKNAGDITQGDKTGDTPLPDKVKVWLKEKYNKPGNVFCGVIHRLDRPTSGVVLFAKTSKALTRMNALFRTKEVEKIYWAIVEKKPTKKEDTLINFLAKNDKQNKSYVSNESNPKAKKAILHYHCIGESDRYALLEITLETGRHHQIRCQLSNAGMTIKGDVKYGANRSNKDGSISLHARYLYFTHPVSKEKIAISAHPPKDNLWDYFSENNSSNHVNSKNS